MATNTIPTIPEIHDLTPLDESDLSILRGRHKHALFLSPNDRRGSTRVPHTDQFDCSDGSTTEDEVIVKIFAARSRPFTPSRFSRRRAAAADFFACQGVTQLVDRGKTDGHPYVVTPYFANGSLADQLKHGPMPWHRAAQLVMTTAQIVAKAHESGITLGDIRPSRILLADPDTPVVNVHAMTSRSDRIAATPFAAPETLTSRLKPTSDVYALGISLAVLLGGVTHLDDDESPTDLIGNYAPTRIRDIVAIATNRDRRNRYSSAHFLADAIYLALHGGSNPEKITVGTQVPAEITVSGNLDLAYLFGDHSETDDSEASSPGTDEDEGVSEPITSAAKVKLTVDESALPVANIAQPITPALQAFTMSSPNNESPNAASSTLSNWLETQNVFTPSSAVVDDLAHVDPADSVMTDPGDDHVMIQEVTTFRAPSPQIMSDADTTTLPPVAEGLPAGAVSTPTWASPAIASHPANTVANYADVPPRRLRDQSDYDYSHEDLTRFEVLTESVQSLLMYRRLSLAGIATFAFIVLAVGAASVYTIGQLLGQDEGTGTNVLAASDSIDTTDKIFGAGTQDQNQDVPVGSGENEDGLSLFPLPPEATQPDEEVAGPSTIADSINATSSTTVEPRTTTSTTAQPTTTTEPETTTTAEPETTTTEPETTTTTEPETTTVAKRDLIASFGSRRIRPNSAEVRLLATECVTVVFTYTGDGPTVPVSGGPQCEQSHAIRLGSSTPPLEPGTTYSVTAKVTAKDGTTDSATLEFTTAG